MTRRLPIIPTIIVLLAMALMIGLGIWQIRRAHWKEDMLARFTAAAGAPVLDGIPFDATSDSLAFRHAHLFCTVSTAPSQLGGPSRGGDPGFRNIVGCELSTGRRMMADIGWAPVQARPVMPPIGQRIEARGELIPDDVLAKRIFAESAEKVLPVLVVMDRPLSGMGPSVPPTIADIPNNHRAYAVQWFIFAGLAGIIYLLALRRQIRVRPTT